MAINQFSERFVTIDGQQLKNCSTTAYLGLNHHPQAQEFYLEGIKQFGLSYGSSPLTDPKVAIYAEFEEKIASVYQTEEAVLFPSGFAASQAVVQSLRDELVEIYYSSFRHPSLKVDNEFKGSKRAFVTDFVDPLHCVKIDQEDLPDEMVYTVLDASHAFGLFDEELADYGRNPQFIICGSLNKGLSTQAGIVLCNRDFATTLRKNPMYATSSPPAPPACSTLLNIWSFGLLREQQNKLTLLLDLLTQKPETFQSIAKLPVLSFRESSQEIYKRFLENGILTWFNEYPKNSGRKVNRLIIHAGLEIEDIQQINTIITEGF